MKKTLSILLAMLMAFPLFACNNDVSDDGGQTNPPTQDGNGGQGNSNQGGGNGGNEQGGDNAEGTMLLVPQLTINENVVTWSPVANAIGYMYKIGQSGVEIFTPATSVTLNEGETLYVKALGDEEEYLSSNWSAPITYSTSQDDNTQGDDNQGDNNQGNQPPAETTVTRQTYGSYWLPQTDYTTMPIGAYNGLPPSGKYGYTYNYDKVLSDYNELGVNFLFGLYNYINGDIAAEKATLELCEKYDIAYLSRWSNAHFETSSNLNNQKRLLSELTKYSSFLGVSMVDEPGYKAFSHMATARETFSNALGENADDYLYYCNLLPNWAGCDVLYNYQAGAYAETNWEVYKNYTYANYLADYMRIYKPQVLSYDFYPMVGEGSKLKDGYFENLSVIRKTALDANVPFWTFVQTCAWDVGQRLPSQGELLWNVNTCLAYGAKGIEYFCGMEPWNSTSSEHFYASLFFKDGSRVSSVYESTLLANKQIQAVDEVLMCAKNEGVIFAGQMPALNDGTTRKMTPSTGDVLNSYKQLTSVSAHHAVIGCFDYNGKTALYVVNNSTTKTGGVNLQFAQSVNGYCIRQGVKQSGFNASSLTLDLGIGEGVLVVLN